MDVSSRCCPRVVVLLGGFQVLIRGSPAHFMCTDRHNAVTRLGRTRVRVRANGVY